MKKELPEGWKEYTLNNLLTNLESGKRTKSSDVLKNEIPSIGGEHINSEGSFKLENMRYIPRDFFCKMNKGKINFGDILVVKDGATTGKVAMVKADFPFLEAAVNEHVFICRPRKELIIPSYLFYHVFSDCGQHQIQKSFHGSAQGGITLEFARQYKLLVPPLETQQKIVAILEKAEETKKLRSQADELTQKLLQSVFLEMFGDPVKNPKGWNTKKIGELTVIKTGGTPSRDIEDYWRNGTLPWVKTTEIKENTIYNTEECITEPGYHNSNATLLPHNSILIAMYGQGKTRGKTAKLGIQATTNQACAAILPSNEFDSDFLWNFLRISYNTLRNLGRGGNQPNLNLSMIKDFKIYFPPIESQKIFSKVFEKIEMTKQSQQQSSLEINNLFDILIQKAFTGELVL